MRNCAVSPASHAGRHGMFFRAGGSILAFSMILPPALAQPMPEIGPQVRIDTGGDAAANETTASVSEANPREIIAGWNDWRQSGGFEIINAGFSLSLDGGESWSDFLLRPPPPNQSLVEGDPMTAFDPRTGTIWAGAISFTAGSQSGIYVARKDPGASTFNPSVMARTSSGTDKPWMAAGPRPGEPDSTRLYITYNEGVLWSDDMGDTWTGPLGIGSGIGFLPRVGPNGTLYIAYWDFGAGMMLKRSTDGGASFTTHTIATRMDVWGVQDGSRFPGTFRVPSLCYLDIDSSGRLYAAYFDTTSTSGMNFNVDIYFTRSDDHGETWQTPRIVNGDAFPPGDQFFCWLEADAQSRLHLVYLDTRHTPQDDGIEHGMFDAYYAYSVNGGDTWHEFRLTPSSFNSHLDGLDRSTQFMGDYLGLSVAGHRAFPVYPDTRSGDPDINTNVVTLPLSGDVDGDGQVSFGDLLFLLSTWGPCQVAPCPADLDGSGAINLQDLLIVLAHWSER